MAIDKTKLTGVEKVYPLNVSPYEQYMGDFQNPSVVSKINAMIQSLHQIGRLTNETVSQWNSVMKWIVEGGMDEIAETITNEKVTVALNEVMRMLDVSLDNGLKELAENVTDKKIDEMVESGQFESMVQASLVELNEVVENKLDGFNLQLQDKAAKSVVDEKRDKAVKIGSLDVSDELLTMFSPSGSINPVTADNTISAEKTTFLKPGKNLFNKTKRTLDYYVASLDGVLKNNVAGYDASDFMMIEGGKNYVLSHVGQWAEYDASKNFIVGHTSSEKTAILNSSTKYVRVSVPTANVNAFQFERGTVSSLYVPFELNIVSTETQPINLLTGVIKEEVGKVTDTAEKLNITQKTLGLTIEKTSYPNPVTIQSGVSTLRAIAFEFDTSSYVGQEINVDIKTLVGKIGLDSTTFDRLRLFAYDSTGTIANYNPTDSNTTILDKPLTFNNFEDKEPYISEEVVSYVPTYPKLFILLSLYSKISTSDVVFSSGIELKINGVVSTPTNKGVGKTYGSMPVGDWLGETHFYNTSYTSNKIVSIVGDSISTYEGYNPVGNRVRYPQSNLATNVNETWWKHILNETGMTLGINESWAGSRVTWDGITESDDRGVSKHMASDARINKLGSNGQPDIIFFYGGTNDLSGNVPVGTFNSADFTTKAVDTFANAYSTALIKMQTAYPKAKIICLTPMYVANTNYSSVTLNAYVDKINEIADFFGAEFIDMRKSGITLFNYTGLLPDGIHPNGDGMKLMADHIMNSVGEILK